MNYKYALGKKFIDPEEIKPLVNDLATLDPVAIMEIANKLVGQSGFSHQDVDEVAKTSRVIRRMQALIN